jgi:hypothetical protein
MDGHAATKAGMPVRFFKVARAAKHCAAIFARVYNYAGLGLFLLT